MSSINGHLFKQTVAYCKQIIFFEAANADVVINGHLSKQMVAYCKQNNFLGSSK